MCVFTCACTYRDLRLMPCAFMAHSLYWSIVYHWNCSWPCWLIWLACLSRGFLVVTPLSWDDWSGDMPIWLLCGLCRIGTQALTLLQQAFILGHIFSAWKLALFHGITFTYVFSYSTVFFFIRFAFRTFKTKSHSQKYFLDFWDKGRLHLILSVQKVYFPFHFPLHDI